MKNNKTGFITALAVFSLFFIGGVLAVSYVKNRRKHPQNVPNAAQVLGEKIESLAAPTSYLGLKQSVENTIQSTLNTTKDSVSQKMIEAEKSVIESINQEVANLTKSQVEALKVQICRDLGVLPTVTPAP